MKVLITKAKAVRSPEVPATSDLNKVSVWAVIIDGKGRILITKRSKRANNPLLLNFPGGGVDEGENTLQTMLREIKEEVGIQKGKLNVVATESFMTNSRWHHVFVFTTKPRKVRFKLNNESISGGWLEFKKIVKQLKNRKLWHDPTYFILTNPQLRRLVETNVSLVTQQSESDENAEQLTRDGSKSIQKMAKSRKSNAGKPAASTGWGNI